MDISRIRLDGLGWKLAGFYLAALLVQITVFLGLLYVAVRVVRYALS